ncbi:hypothetical protein HN784_00255 [bacterium]|jgi:nanoRNase/pAp phosphatase (c-di-AMP/oligoRNAs hydrolase)|nr:hypothetical protein [bacterium]MBT4250988.1 hypothetical protein [bacterium]MBT4597780.1 hypothetical protein [bacterium]MBT6753875.1 hypothetical protein [bacterium]MBT7037413.1 hypothetical protein [bacterium]
MSASANEAIPLINKSEEILLILPSNPTDDILSSAFALHQYFKKHNKKSYFFHKQEIPKRLSFLKKPEKILETLNGSRDFVLMFKTKYNKILNVNSENMGEHFEVRVTPEKGSIDPRDFSFMPADFKYDLVVTFGTPSLESLGEIYHENTDLFFEIPKINIDNKSSNENYGQANVIDVTASSIAEICTGLILEHDESKFDKEIAQALLTGIISATESFQMATTTPRAMIAAARLMKYKANQSTVIRYLYKTKSFSFLKLWGRVMAHLEWDEETKMAWTLIEKSDFEESGASYEDIPYILEEIQKNFFEGQIFGIFYNEESSETAAQMYFADISKAKQIAKEYDIEATGNLIKINFDNKKLVTAEKDFMHKLENTE